MMDRSDSITDLLRNEMRISYELRQHITALEDENTQLERERDAARETVSHIEAALTVCNLQPSKNTDLPTWIGFIAEKVNNRWERIRQLEVERHSARVALGTVVTKIESMLERHEKQLSVDQRGRLYAIAGIAMEAQHALTPAAVDVNPALPQEEA